MTALEKSTTAALTGEYHYFCEKKITERLPRSPEHRNSMKTPIRLLSILFLSSLAAGAEGIRISEVHLLGGGGGATNQPGSLADFRSLAPGSSILRQNLDGYENNRFLYMGSNTFSSLQLGLQFTRLPAAVLRLGISNHIQTDLLSRSGYKEERFPFDTLISSQTGTQYFTDSVHYEQYRFAYGNRQLRVDGNLLFRLHPEKRWVLQGGIGLSFGYTYSSTTELEYSAWDETGYGYYGAVGHPGNNNLPFREQQTVRETFENDNVFGGGIYAPLGLDFRVGKRREFWKPIHFYFETRPGIEFNAIPGKGLQVSVGSYTGFGLRIDLPSAQ